MDCSKQCATQQAKFEVLADDVCKLLEEVNDASNKLQALGDLLQNSFRDEFEQIANQISETSEVIYQKVKEQGKRLDQFEIKINNFQLPDNDMMQIQKDASKYREMLVLVETQTDSIQERISDTKCEIELRENQLITADDMDLAKQSLKTVERLDGTDLCKITQLIDKLE